MNGFKVLLKSLLLSFVLLAGSAFAMDTVDINTADAAQLERALVGIGAAKAEAIVEYRTSNGPFKSADELALVKGIGLKTVERNRELIVVGTAKEPAPRAAQPEAAPARPVVRR
ncbi:helix-hairpin-helix domain-containing protein [Xanthomonas sp. XNM01]|uniref:helix-hairpin-helix domain-containing protein n=1 Tax=Xanthomonas sp. XNM01 TaxID=2769289 RepID=UPI00178291E2|nr:helix-hairpin-helix domain-containing protein [Xanthomonas sp. XNM01]